MSNHRRLWHGLWRRMDMSVFTKTVSLVEHSQYVNSLDCRTLLQICHRLESAKQILCSYLQVLKYFRHTKRCDVLLLPYVWRYTIEWSCMQADFNASFFLCIHMCIFSEWLNTTHVYNKDIIARALARPSHVPLITVSNHHSCFDEPGLWGMSVLFTCFHWFKKFDY